MALAYPIIRLLQANRIWLALVLVAISLGFIVNMAFVIVSRTAMVTMPIMLAVFALLHLKWRTSVDDLRRLGRHGGIGLGDIAAVAARRPDDLLAATIGSTRTQTCSDVDRAAAGVLEEIAAVLCRGAGRRTRYRFDARTVRAGRHRRYLQRHRSQVIGNPHNQTLERRSSMGHASGSSLLYAMWLAHLLLFRGDGLVAWIGLLVVVQNIFTSLFNSHIFDFHEGWMYVLGVGVAGGMTLAARQHSARATGRVVVMAADHQRREINSIGSMLSVMASARHDPFARMLNVDLIAVLVALLLPWSTSGVGIGMRGLACRSGRRRSNCARSCVRCSGRSARCRSRSLRLRRWEPCGRTRHGARVSMR